MDDVAKQRLALQVFGEVCGLPRRDRQAAAEARCGDDLALRRRVEALLRADEEPSPHLAGEQAVSDYLASQVRGVGHADSPAPASGEANVPGHYRILRVLGEGGMATVYEAEQVHPRRHVAIKVIRGGAYSPGLRRRFEYEAQVLAKLHHPGIAQLYEAETRFENTPEGRGVECYLAMELVRGVPIDQYAGAHAPGTREKLELVLGVCEAVEYAHRMGVVHRDLKPPNILVDSGGRPKVLDFGVARVIRQDPHWPGATMTDAGHLVGTLGYMSPEQVDARLGAADTRCDVYALGALLYKMLTGVLPIDVDADGIATAAARICTEVPAKVGDRDRRFRGDLEIILAKALEKAPDRRYPSVQALADDLQRFLDGRAIEARGDSALYVLRKTAWRYRLSLAAAGAFLVLLACFAVYARLQATRNAGLAEAATKSRDESLAAKAAADQRSAELRRSLYLSSIGFAQSALGSHDVARVRELLRACPPDLRGWEWQYLLNQCDQSVSVRPLAGRNGRPVAASTADVSRDGARMAIGTGDGLALVGDGDGRILFERRFPGAGTVAVALSPDGSLLACGPRMDELSIVELDSGKELWAPPAPATPPRFQLLRRQRALRFSPDGALLAAAGYDGRLRLYAARTGELRWDVDARCLSVLCLAFTPSGQAVAGGDNTGVARLWRTNDGTVRHEVRAHDDAIASLAISADGRQLATGGSDGQVSVRSVQDWSESARLRVGNCILWSIAFSGDGAALAFGADDNLMRLWRPPALNVEALFRGHAAQVNFVSFEADGRHLTSVAADATLRRWRVDGTVSATMLTLGNAMTQDAVFTPDGKRVLIACNDGTVLGWDLATGAEGWRHRGDLATLRSLALDAAQNRIAVGDNDGVVRIIDQSDGRLIRTLPPERPGLASVGFVPGGTLLAAAYESGAVKVWDASSGRHLSEVTTPSGATGLAVHPDGRALATGGLDGVVRVWSVPEGALLATGDAGAPVGDLRYSPDGATLAYSRADGAVILADAVSLKPRREFAGHRGPVTGLAFHPSGKRLASGGADRIIRVWDVTGGQEVLSLRGHVRHVHRLAFSADGSLLVSTSADRTARLWDAAPRP